MDPEQLEEVSNEIEGLHKSMKNVIKIVFAISPLLVLSMQGWASKSLNSIYLLRVSLTKVLLLCLLTINKIFNALGNGWPQILVQLEDLVLECIISITEEKLLEEAVQILYSLISPLMEVLGNDQVALAWFDLYDKPPPENHSTPLLSEVPLTALARASMELSNFPGYLPKHLNKDRFPGQ